MAKSLMFSKVVIRAVVLLLALVVSGCESTGKFNAFEHPSNKFTPGLKNYFSSELDLSKKMSGLQAPAVGSFQAHITDNRASWYMSVIYSDREWLFLESLSFEIDGNTYASPNRMPGTGRAHSRGGVTESGIFILSDELLNALTNATAVSTRLAGGRGRLDRDWTPIDVHNTKWFIGFMKSKLPGSSPDQKPKH